MGYIRAKSELGLSGEACLHASRSQAGARRLPNCNLEEEKSLKKTGRGSFDIRVETNHNICAVKWYDSRAVTLVSSFAGPDPVQKIQHLDKANKSRRWYIFWHTIILAVINAWLLYKRECKALKTPKQEILTMRHGYDRGLRQGRSQRLADNATVMQHSNYTMARFYFSSLPSNSSASTACTPHMSAARDSERRLFSPLCPPQTGQRRAGPVEAAGVS
ncbi:hypothetical protein JOQ06_014662 [Pogonophryne albipinna]|uniref:PiggyBac transposable element-derived protein domain-containing protein n=1 Tax=Pogonophryne albipinna TaxID=1090488 RepID=A0AAD6ALE2_9TELE|nr:hypothetical protein JOQ06_014662 [Pogonophryne albipinna]